VEALKTHFGKNLCVGDEKKIRDFARSIDDENPLHHDNEATKGAGLQGIIAPGVMILGFVSSIIAKEIPWVMIHRLDVRFKKPVYAGSVLAISCTVLRQRRVSADVAITIKNGLDTVAEGSCQLLLPQW